MPAAHDSAFRLLGVTLLVGFTVGTGLGALLDVRVEDKQLSGLEWSPGPSEKPAPSAAAARPFELRLVDAGGVGIPADTAAWGGSYSHATYAFDQLILREPPWVDAAAFARVRADWDRYLERMARYGNNGVVLDAFLELINFDRDAVYGAGDPLRARHDALRAAFG